MNYGPRLHIKRDTIKKDWIFKIQSFFIYYFSLDKDSLKWSNKWLIKSSNFL